ncbi:MAG: hypothetical protein A2W93_13590 [Bacteroidetes bacterium GWF2_43_63]|nr:MAG: hypothetical protein A2W94_03785 [Bacteroidetes bacterium GWE2_42_42]OFY55022.1 MAG: hypothetical protein A2W93_13590 [Bacteroidetes bacterium GWF2_43_63]HBG69558.1 hypothetical protein [Bacteroidales bacterium]HCB60703.1 hypothetical protein [Bacteroidales bacterium]HCY23993.1 hypothetical protein [Bacteroidales bacterium]
MGLIVISIIAFKSSMKFTPLFRLSMSFCRLFDGVYPAVHTSTPLSMTAAGLSVTAVGLRMTAISIKVKH